MNHTNSFADTPEDEIALIVIGSVALGSIVTGAGALWLTGTSLLVKYGLLVPAATHPLLLIPGSDAGLDLPRLAILVGILLAGIAALVSSAKRAWARRQEVR